MEIPRVLYLCEQIGGLYFPLELPVGTHSPGFLILPETDSVYPPGTIIIRAVQEGPEKEPTEEDVEAVAANFDGLAAYYAERRGFHFVFALLQCSLPYAGSSPRSELKQPLWILDPLNHADFETAAHIERFYFVGDVDGDVKRSEWSNGK